MDDNEILMNNIRKKKEELDKRESALAIAEKEFKKNLEAENNKLKIAGENLRKFRNTKEKELQEREDGIAREKAALAEREKALDEQEKSLGVKCAQVHSEALDAFNKNFVDYQAKYYERYNELEQKYEGTFDKYTQARENQLAELQKQYLERNEQLRKDYVELVAEFQKNVQEEAGRASELRAKVLGELQEKFQKQAEEYQVKFVERLAGIEGSHQEKVLGLQSLYDEYYASFQNELMERQKKIADRFAEAETELEKEYLSRQEALQQQLRDRLEEIQQKLEEHSSKSLQEEAERRQQAWQEHQDKLQKSFEENEAANQRLAEELRQKHQQLVDRETEVNKLTQENTEKESELMVREQLLETRKQTLEDKLLNIEDEVQRRIEEREESWASEKENLKQEIERLRDACDEAREEAAFSQGIEGLLDGRSLPEALAELEAKKEETRRAITEFNQREDERAKQNERKYLEAKAELEQLREAYNTLEQTRQKETDIILQSTAAKTEQAKLELENEALNQSLEVQTRTVNMLREELRQYVNSSNDNKQKRDARIAILKKPTDDEEHIRLQIDGEGAEQEEKWLKNIELKCEAAGFDFHPRILRAFHTALKTAEWSPLAVLAGVSGTGKSELPRLYSAFGGIQYHMVSVQPNWDSQESMLGYFNTVDNKFDAQDVLRFLVQSQTEKTLDEPYGLKDCMNLVLLDEMNLAYVELYFAEFLSKLELRRGMKEKVNLEVKIGAGQEPYALELGRNLLWTGTMNQDETTKALSDKVLDRSFIINFPRPQKLVSRRELPELKAADKLLPYSTWDSWCVKEVNKAFSDEEISPFRETVERINNAMGMVGRAIGHRVWQSMEYYMANYPQVRSGESQERQYAMNHAFEDQIVQKIMPKLRGIETRKGSQGDKCLQRIKGILSEDEITKGLLNDFQGSCDSGYGQFIWNSAEYLNASGVNEPHDIKFDNE